MKTFASWDELLEHCRRSTHVLYQAPLDPGAAPVICNVRGRRVRCTPLTAAASAFTADEGHLPRFRRP